jgi:hypothetical protein
MIELSNRRGVARKRRQNDRHESGMTYLSIKRSLRDRYMSEQAFEFFRSLRPFDRPFDGSRRRCAMKSMKRAV